MRRKWIWLLSLLYLVACLGFSAYESMQNPLWNLNTRTIGEMVGGGLAIYGASALLPVIGWAVARFRRQAAPPAFVAWLLIGAAFAYLSDAGKRIDRPAPIAKARGASVFSGKDREDFEQSVKLGCVETQRADPLTVKVGITEAKITLYCECISARLAEAISSDELRYAASNGKPPRTLVDKRTVIAEFCRSEALRN